MDEILAFLEHKRRDLDALHLELYSEGGQIVFPQGSMNGVIHIGTRNREHWISVIISPDMSINQINRAIDQAISGYHSRYYSRQEVEEILHPKKVYPTRRIKP